MEIYMNTRNLTTIGLSTAVLCILGPLSLVLPFSPVPISLGTLGVMLISIILDAKSSMLCTTLYLLLGLAGLPVFTGFMGGVGKLLGPTGGYMLGYLFLAYIGSKLAKKWHPSFLLQAFGFFIGMVFCYLFGTIWLMLQMQLDIVGALWTGVIPYIPFDIGKIFASLLLGRRMQARIRRQL